MQPPDFVPRQFRYERQTAWPATQGSLRQLEIGLGGVGRWQSSRGFGATGYAGLGYLRLSGETQSLAYTSFHLGGHSVLFPEQYRLSATLTPSSTWGLNAGGELDIPVASSLSVVVGYRAFVGRAARLSVRLDSILNDRGQAAADRGAENDQRSTGGGREDQDRIRIDAVTRDTRSRQAAGFIEGAG
ncbi:MAG: hypothetical protein HYS05_17830 [Acidobacteria bacterium]|nr:hypothetical protein [Acidobacteriota bacterium]